MCVCVCVYFVYAFMYADSIWISECLLLQSIPELHPAQAAEFLFGYWECLDIRNSLEISNSF